MEGDTEQELFTWSFSSSNLIFLQTGQDDFIIAIWRIRFSFLYTFHLERSFGILDKGDEDSSKLLIDILLTLQMMIGVELMTEDRDGRDDICDHGNIQMLWVG